MLTPKQKELLLSQETFDKFGYWPEDLSDGSRKVIINKCEVCGISKETKWGYFLKGITTHAGCGYIKRKQVIREKYGVDAPAQLESVQQKARQTCMAHLGVPYAMQSKVVQQKSIKACLKKYGISSLRAYSFDI